MKTRSRCHRMLRNESGQNLVEFAIVCPIFILIILGLLQFIFLIFQYQAVYYATKQGIRIAVTSPAESESILRTEIKKKINESLSLYGLGGVEPTIVMGGENQPVTVQVAMNPQVWFMTWDRPMIRAKTSGFRNHAGPPTAPS